MEKCCESQKGAHMELPELPETKNISPVEIRLKNTNKQKDMSLFEIKFALEEEHISSSELEEDGSPLDHVTIYAGQTVIFYDEIREKTHRIVIAAHSHQK